MNVIYFNNDTNCCNLWGAQLHICAFSSLTLTIPLQIHWQYTAHSYRVEILMWVFGFYIICQYHLRGSVILHTAFLSTLVLLYPHCYLSARGLVWDFHVICRWNRILFKENTMKQNAISTLYFNNNKIVVISWCAQLRICIFKSLVSISPLQMHQPCHQ